ncbi:MAG: sugar transporter, partial [Flavobacterium sp.]
MKKITYVLTLFFVLLLSFSVHAQDMLKSKDLSTVKVDYLSQEDIVKIAAQLKSNNMTIDEAEPMALSKGMSQTEFDKLKGRVKDLSYNSGSDAKADQFKNNKTQFGREQENIVNNKVKDSSNALIFGSELFDNPTLNFEPDLKLATPM